MASGCYRCSLASIARLMRRYSRSSNLIIIEELKLQDKFEYAIRIFDVRKVY